MNRRGPNDWVAKTPAQAGSPTGVFLCSTSRHEHLSSEGPTGPPPTDPGAAIGAALNAIFQQIAAAVAQAYADAAQQIVQAAATVYVNALAQAINNALGSLFTGLATPAAQQQTIAARVNAAKMSASSLKIEPATSGVLCRWRASAARPL